MPTQPPKTAKAKDKKAKEKQTSVIKHKTDEQTKIDANIYPIGKQPVITELTDDVLNKLIQDIHILPQLLKEVAKKINKKKKLQYSYREGGWTIEQIIHHIADSHLNAFLRFKLALTENNPTVSPYDENLWAETADVQLPIKVAIKLVKAVHTKWVALLENMDKNDWKRTYFHPAYNKKYSLEEVISTYAWHGKHHVAQIEVALKNN